MVLILVVAELKIIIQMTNKICNLDHLCWEGIQLCAISSTMKAATLCPPHQWSVQHYALLINKVCNFVSSFQQSVHLYALPPINKVCNFVPAAWMNYITFCTPHKKSAQLCVSPSTTSSALCLPKQIRVILHLIGAHANHHLDPEQNHSHYHLLFRLKAFNNSPV